MVFRSTTFRLDSLAGIFDTRRQHTGVPCLSSPFIVTRNPPLLTFGLASYSVAAPNNAPGQRLLSDVTDEPTVHLMWAHRITLVHRPLKSANLDRGSQKTLAATARPWTTGHLVTQALGSGNGLKGTHRHRAYNAGTYAITQQPGKKGTRLSGGEEAHYVNAKAGNQRRVLCSCPRSHPALTTPTEQPAEASTSSGSDEEVEFASTERDDDRRKTLLDSMQTGDSESLDLLKQTSKLEDYNRFFHLPGSSYQGEPPVPRDEQNPSGVSPAVSDEVIDLSLSTDDEGAEDVTAATSSAPGGCCDIQRTITSASVTYRPHGPLNGKWACPICTLYAPFSYLALPSLPSPHPSTDHPPFHCFYFYPFHSPSALSNRSPFFSQRESA